MIKFLGKKIGGSLGDLEVGKFFFRYDTKNTSDKRKNTYFGLHQNVELLCYKQHNEKVKRQPREWERCL